MKRFLDQDYYEMLEIEPTASKEEIRKAYHLMKEAFRPDSIATYSLFQPEELFQIQNKIEEAYRVLMNDRERSLYDSQIHSSKGSGRPPSYGEGDLPVLFDPIPRTLDAEAGAGGLEKPDISPCTGESLKRYREWKGISLEEVSGKTRINILYLQYIESDHFAGLPHSVYLRSYLFQYAEALGVDSGTVVEGYLKRLRGWQGQNRDKRSDPSAE